MVAYATDSPLNLLKKPSETTLQQIQKALETYLEDTEETTPLNQIASDAGQMYGVFTMIDQPQAASLMRELETVSQQLASGAVAEPITAQEALLEAVLQAPRYFEWLQQDQQGQQTFDIQPLITQLQIARGESSSTIIRPELRQLATRLRPVLQRALLEVLRGQNTALEQISQVCARLRDTAGDESVYRLFWLAEGLMSATLSSLVKPNRELKLLLRDLDQYVKQLQDGAVPAQINEQSEQLSVSIRKKLANSPSGTEWLQQADYQPPRGAPAPLGPITTPRLADNKALLTVVELLQESILISQDSFDRFARDRSRHELLEGQTKRLQDLANVLTLLDLTVPAKLLQKHLVELSQWTAGSEPASTDAIFQAACDLVLVQSCLSSLNENVYSQEMAALHDDANNDANSAELLHLLELRRARKLIAEESHGYIDKAWGIAASHVASGQVPSWDELLPILHRVGGTLTMLDCGQAQQMTQRLQTVIESLTSDADDTNSTQVLNGFADVIVSLEHYLSLLVSHDKPSEAILSHAEAELAALESQCGITPAPFTTLVVQIEQATEAAATAIEPSIDLEIDTNNKVDSDHVSLHDDNTEVETSLDNLTIDTPSDAADATSDTNFIDFSEATDAVADVDATPTPAPTPALALDLSESITDIETSSTESVEISDDDNDADVEFDFDFVASYEATAGVPTKNPADDDLNAELADLDLDVMNSTTDSNALDSSRLTDNFSFEPEPPPKMASDIANDQEEDPLDAEIREIFAEEARGEVANISDNLSAWRADLADRDAQTSIRRSFHTLKGSGRMVGQDELGNFAWSFEQLMNRVLDGQITPDQTTLDAVGDARQFLESIVHDINHFDTSDPALTSLAERADAIISGQVIAATPVVVDPADALTPEDDAAAETETDSETQFDAAALEAFTVHDTDEITVFDSDEITTEKAITETSAESEPSDRLEKFTQENVLNAKSELADNEPAFSTETTEPLPTITPEATAINELTSDTEASAELEPANAELNVDTLSEDTLSEAKQIASATAEPLAIAPPEPAISTEPDAIPAELDPELLEALLEEASEILDTSDSTLQSWTAEPDNYELLNDLRRDLHTLKGGSRMAGFMSIGDLAHAMESVLEAISRGEMATTAAPTDTLQSTLDTLNRMFNQVRNNEPIQPADALISELNQVLGTEDAAPQAAAEAAGSDFAAAFLDEAKDILASSDISLNRWSQALDNREMLEDLRRDVHTLNGNAQMAESESISHLAGATASLLDAVSKQQLEPSAEIIDILQQSLDGLNTNVARLKDQAEPAPVDNVVNQIKSLLGQETTSASAVKSAAIALPKTAKPMSVPAAAKPASGKPAAAASADTIRVGSDLLTTLTNQMGESSIYRARVEQGVNGFRFNLNELDQTVNRLRQQLRRLEIETESQILFRHDDGKDHGPDFDPLELDRFSELQQVSRSLMEIIDDLSNVQNSMEDQAQNLNYLLYQQSKVNKDVQENLMQTRMVQFSSAAPRLRRVVRQVAQELGKKVEFSLHGGEAEIDRTVLDNMIAPLEHMLRNAVFHGIETPKNRRESKKPETGSIDLDLRREGAELVLELKDDGAGLNYTAIRSKGEELGWIAPGQAATEQNLIAMMLQPGFSTAKEVSQTAGRGVGMDVLNDAIKGMRGALQIQSEPGLGSRFTIRLPYSMAITQALLVEVGGNLYAVPLLSIEAVDRIDEEELKTYLAGDAVEHDYGQHQYPLYSMGVLFGNEPVPFEDVEDTAPPTLLFRSAEASAALQVDAVLGSQEIIVKPLSPQLLGVPGVNGATMLGDGSVVIVLELAALVRNISAQHAKYEAMFEALQARQEQEVRHLSAMVIDDSITMRKITTRLLQRHDVDVTAAKDGVEAVAMLEDVTPSMIILDIEMPRMDGFEVLAHIRNQARLQQVPVIMVTSRSGEKHRARAAKLGVNDYLIKPYQEEEMMRSVRKVLNPEDLALLN